MVICYIYFISSVSQRMHICYRKVRKHTQKSFKKANPVITGHITLIYRPSVFFFSFSTIADKYEFIVPFFLFFKYPVIPYIMTYNFLKLDNVHNDLSY